MVDRRRKAFATESLVLLELAGLPAAFERPSRWKDWVSIQKFPLPPRPQKCGADAVEPRREGIVISGTSVSSDSNDFLLGQHVEPSK
jgi:hypothetical protein